MKTMNVSVSDIKKTYVKIDEWKKTVISEKNGSVKTDAYDNSIINAFGKSGNLIGYFDVNAGYGEIKSK
jgi:hypothetical protein